MTELGRPLGQAMLCAALLWQLLPALAQPTAAGSGAPAPVTAASAPARPAPATAVSPAPWTQLDARQQQALAPLQAVWPQLTAAQRSKWLTLSTSFEHLNGEERALVHGRMRDWAALSPQARARARLNYSHLQAMSREERKARWEAYQALSAEEKHRLQRRHIAPNSAAPASRPSPARAERLVQPPASAGSSVPAVPLDRKTLLPRPAAATAEGPSLAPAPAASASASTETQDPGTVPGPPGLAASAVQPNPSEVAAVPTLPAPARP